MGIAIFLLVVIVLVILGIMIRNNIVRHHNATIRAWADVTSFERQKLKTLEELAPVVEQYAGMEKSTLEKNNTLIETNLNECKANFKDEH